MSHKFLVKTITLCRHAPSAFQPTTNTDFCTKPRLHADRFSYRRFRTDNQAPTYSRFHRLPRRHDSALLARVGHPLRMPGITALHNAPPAGTPTQLQPTSVSETNPCRQLAPTAFASTNACYFSKPFGRLPHALISTTHCQESKPFCHVAAQQHVALADILTLSLNCLATGCQSTNAFVPRVCREASRQPAY